MYSSTVYVLQYCTIVAVLQYYTALAVYYSDITTVVERKCRALQNLVFPHDNDYGGLVTVIRRSN